MFTMEILRPMSQSENAEPQIKEGEGGERRVLKLHRAKPCRGWGWGDAILQRHAHLKMPSRPLTYMYAGESGDDREVLSTGTGNFQLAGELVFHFNGMLVTAILQ